MCKLYFNKIDLKKETIKVLQAYVEDFKKMIWDEEGSV